MRGCLELVMTKNTNAGAGKSRPGRAGTRKAVRPAGSEPQRAEPPGWATGLRQLYDAVVIEPLPDSFDELLRKLDQSDHD